METNLKGQAPGLLIIGMPNPNKFRRPESRWSVRLHTATRGCIIGGVRGGQLAITIGKPGGRERTVRNS